MRSLPGIVVAVAVTLPAILLPLAAAGTPLTGAAAEVQGQGTLGAGLAGAVLADGAAGPLPGLAVVVAFGTFTLYGETQAVRGPAGSVTPAQHSSSSSPLDGGRADAFDLSAGARLLVLPGTGAQVRLDGLDGLRLAPHEGGARAFQPRASPDPAWELPLKGSLEAQPRAGTLAVSGAFQVVVWAAAFRLHNATGEHEVRTGASDEPIAPGVTRHTQAEAVLDVVDGALQVPLDGGWQVYVGQADLALATGSLRVAAPSGPNPVDGALVAPASRELQLTAPFEGTLAAESGRLALTFAVPPREATLDGAAVRHPGSGPPWLAVLAVLALVAVPLAARALSQERLRRRIAAIDRHMRSRRFGKALETARRVRRRRPTHPDALVGEAMGLLQAGRYAEAEATLGSPGWTAVLGPLRTYLRAWAAAGLGRVEEARRLVAQCLAETPDLAGEVARTPLLAPLMPGPRSG